MKIMTVELQTNKQRIFDTIEEAAEHYKISTKKIESLIESGYKWRGVIYDYID